jgi:hypothetical protein
MLQMWVLQIHLKKINVYFVTFMQVFHITLHVFEVLLLQWCNIAIYFKLVFLGIVFTKYGFHAHIPSMQTYKHESTIAIRQTLYVLMQNITSIKTFKNVQKLENMTSISALSTP